MREVLNQNGEIIKMWYFINDGMFGSFSLSRYQKISRPLTLKSGNEKVFKSIVFGPTCAGEDLVHIIIMNRTQEDKKLKFFEQEEKNPFFSITFSVSLDI